MEAELECPRCLQPATRTASRRGTCTACGAALVVPRRTESQVRDYIYGERRLLAAAPRVAAAVPEVLGGHRA